MRPSLVARAGPMGAGVTPSAVSASAVAGSSASFVEPFAATEGAAEIASSASASVNTARRREMVEVMSPDTTTSAGGTAILARADLLLARGLRCASSPRRADAPLGTRAGGWRVGRRQPPRPAAQLVRPGPAADVLLPSRGRADRPAGAARRRRDRAARPARGAVGGERPLDVLVGRPRHVVRGGERGPRPRARPAPPGRRRAERAPRARRARRRGARGVAPPARAVRDLAAHALVPPARGRPRRPPRALAHGHPLPVQGHRPILVGRFGRRRLVLLQPDPRVPAHRRPRRLLQRAHRPHPRRRAPGAPADTLVAPLSRRNAPRAGGRRGRCGPASFAEGKVDGGFHRLTGPARRGAGP